MMGKEGSFLTTFVAADLYKRTQGRLVRQVSGTAAAILAIVLAWSLSEGPLVDFAQEIRYGIPVALAAVGCWAAYRLVNHPPVADFLIGVEEEMAKVSWPTQGEVYRASVVVLITMVLLSTMLFAYDILWQLILQGLGILAGRPAPTPPGGS